MKPREKNAALIIGLIGAVIGAIFGTFPPGFELRGTHADFGMFMSAVLSAITVFILCFLLSLLYLRIMRGKSWLWGLLLGTGFGATAGVISGILTCACGSTAINLISGSDSGLFSDFSEYASIGVVIGVFIGFFLGLIISLIAGPFYFKKPNNIPVNEPDSPT